MRSILAHKLRSLLTTLGIIFGVAAVVSMLSIADGARREAVDQIRLLGTNNIRINHLELTGDLKEFADAKGSSGLTHSDGAVLMRNLPNLSGVAPVRFVDEPVLFGNTEATGRVIGTTSDYSSVTDFHAVRGRFISALDVREAKRVAVDRRRRQGRAVRLPESYRPQDPHRRRLVHRGGSDGVEGDPRGSGLR